MRAALVVTVFSLLFTIFLIPIGSCSVIFCMVFFIVSGIEKEIQMCYSQITKGKPEAAYPKIIVYLPLTRSAVIIAGNGGYLLLSSYI